MSDERLIREKQPYLVSELESFLWTASRVYCSHCEDAPQKPAAGVSLGEKLIFWSAWNTAR